MCLKPQSFPQLEEESQDDTGQVHDLVDQMGCLGKDLASRFDIVADHTASSIKDVTNLLHSLKEDICFKA